MSYSVGQGALDGTEAARERTLERSALDRRNSFRCKALEKAERQEKTVDQYSLGRYSRETVQSAPVRRMRMAAVSPGRRIVALWIAPSDFNAMPPATSTGLDAGE